jgi:hypothetical protein
MKTQDTAPTVGATANITDAAQSRMTKDFSDLITLDKPVERGNTKIDSITLRRPGSGELRGVSLMDLAQVSVTALMTVLPRITIPSLTAQEVARLDPADMMQLGIEVASFLATRAELSRAFPTS